MTPLLFPVVPDVKMMVAVSPGAGLSESASVPLESAIRDGKDAILASGTSGSCSCRIHIFFSFGHPAAIASKRTVCLGLRKSPSESERSIRSTRSSPGRFASSGTATFLPVMMPR